MKKVKIIKLDKSQEMEFRIKNILKTLENMYMLRTNYMKQIPKLSSELLKYDLKALPYMFEELEIVMNLIEESREVDENKRWLNSTIDNYKF